MRTKSLAGFGVILGLALLALGAQAATYYVATNGLDGNDGQSWSTPFLTISNAVKIAQTNSANVVLVSNGTYLTVAQIVITNAITVRSWNNGMVDRTNTVVQRAGPANHRIFYISNTAAVVEGLTITNGNASAQYYEGTGVWLDRGGTVRNCLITGNGNTNPWNYSGGGVLVSQSGTVDNCLVIGNSNGWYAGGIHMRGGGLVTNCLVASNMANYYWAGGIYVETGGVVVASTIIGNTNGLAGFGGGILVGTNSVVRNCTISYNTIVTRGGGVAVFAGGLVENCAIQSNLTTDTSGGTRSGAGLFLNLGGEARNCLIAGNSGTNGGGVYFIGGGVARNCLIKENIGAISGGGVYFSDSSGNGGKLQNCTVVSNVAASYGGGIYNDARYSSNTPVLIENCVIYRNSAVGSVTTSNYYNWGSYYTYSNCLTAPTNGLLGANNISLNPLFVDGANDNYRLQRGSPGGNTGVNRDWMAGAFDLDGRLRQDRYSGVVDRGCYEYVFPGTMFIIP